MNFEEWWAENASKEMPRPRKEAIRGLWETAARSEREAQAARSKLDTQEWMRLSRSMAVEAIARDLCDIMVPYQDAIQMADHALNTRNQRALEVECRMGQALLALEKLGYILTPRDV